MQERIHDHNDDELIVEELTRKEFVEWALATIDAVEECGSEDDTLWVEYEDGTRHSCGYGSDGRFRKTGIVWGCISNGSTQQVLGAYELDENGIVQKAGHPQDGYLIPSGSSEV